MLNKTNTNLKLEVGKYYQDRSNKVHYLTHTRKEDGDIYYCSEDVDYWYGNGCYSESGRQSQLDLIHEVEIKIINNNIGGDEVTKDIISDTRIPVSIEVGKKYRDRIGEVHHILLVDKDAGCEHQYNSYNSSWLKSGWYFKENEPSYFDLIEEVSQSTIVK